MTTQSEKMDNLVMGFNVSVYRTTIDDKRVSVKCLAFKRVREDITDAVKGEFVGTIDVLYPVAGLNVQLTLDVTHDFCEDFEMECGMFKLPFVDELVSIEELEFELHHLTKEPSYNEEPPYKLHEGCEGYWRPMYDQFPNWIFFCTKCDARYEDHEMSPLPY